MAGCLGRQVSPSCPTGGGGEDAQELKVSKRARWDVKIKTCKFLSCPPAWATAAFLPPTLGFHTFLDFNGSGMLQTLNFFVLCLCYRSSYERSLAPRDSTDRT